MMETPLVSILMISYNSSRFIREAIESVLAQTYKNLELLICDDQSTDQTWSIINEYRDERIVRIRNESNLGEYPNRNKAIRLARGEYLIFIDADDFVYPHGVDFMVKYAMSFPECGMIISRPWNERVIYPMRITPRELYCFEYLDSGAIGINFTKVLFRTDTVKLKSFPEKVKLGDLFLQYDVGKVYDSLLIPDASTWWRRTTGQASEKLLNDYGLYLQHELWIKFDMLRDSACPLSEEEKRMAYDNIYGNYLRYLLSQIFRLRFLKVFKLFRIYSVPLMHFRSFWVKQRRDYFAFYTGDNPMRLRVDV